MARVKIGDVVEISTCKGLAYAQYTHKNRLMGNLLRVFPGFHAIRPADFHAIVTGKPGFMTFFPLGAAVNRGIVAVVSNLPVPDHARPFPLFRAAGNRDRDTGKIKDWWLWDGDKEWRVGNITEEQRMLPIRGIWNDTMLIEQIESEWTPETDPF